MLESFWVRKNKTKTKKQSRSVLSGYSLPMHWSRRMPRGCEGGRESCKPSIQSAWPQWTLRVRNIVCCTSQWLFPRARFHARLYIRLYKWSHSSKKHVEIALISFFLFDVGSVGSKCPLSAAGNVSFSFNDATEGVQWQVIRRLLISYSHVCSYSFKWSEGDTKTFYWYITRPFREILLLW